MNFIRYSLASMKKSSLKLVADLVNDYLATPKSNFNHLQWYLAILEIIECKLYKPPKEKVKHSPSSNICHVIFENKAIELINLARIFHDNDVINALPRIPEKFDTPTVVYSLSQPIRSKIFNFNKFSSELDTTAFVKDNSIVPCACQGSSFVDSHHNHVVSGDLRIVKKSKLRKLLTRGPKYREPTPLDWVKARDC